MVVDVHVVPLEPSYHLGFQFLDQTIKSSQQHQNNSDHHLHAHLNSNEGITLLRMGSLSMTTDTVSRPILFIVTAPPHRVLTFLCQNDFPDHPTLLEPLYLIFVILMASLTYEPEA